VNRKCLLFSLLLFGFFNLYSQESSEKEFIKEVKKADFFYLYDHNYEKAAELYEPLYKIYPDNSNLCAKLGICYLNVDGKKSDALRLLLKASENIAATENDYEEYGDKAPADTYFYLAIAYHRNDSLQKAITGYSEVKRNLKEGDYEREQYIDNQIRDCRYAINMKKKPLTIISDLFMPWLNEYPGAYNPVLSRNDSVFIFTYKKEGKTRILCSYKPNKSKEWERPVDITNQIGGLDRFYSNSITGDGKLLVLFLDDGYDGNLYYSQRSDTTWSKIKGFGKPINTIYWESHGFITPDGRTIYFSSNRPGGSGQLDIWISERADDGEWGEPVSCGEIINTPYNEDTPFFDPVSNALLFSSDGHISMGSYDVFRSVKRNGAWTDPVGIPYAFNNTASNTFFILNNNAPGFITSLYNEKTNQRNIYSVVALDPADKITLANGTISLSDGMTPDPKQVKILLSDLKKDSQIRNLELIDSSSFKTELKPGDYQIFISHTGYKTDTINLNIPLYFAGNYISVNSSLIPDKVINKDFLSINNILFEFDSYKLNSQAVSVLEKLKSVLVSQPELKIEVTGFTDAKGSNDYNRKLADKRVQSVTTYLTSSGISGSRLIKKAYGESNSVAINTNLDGSDNPEGRKYNRRVTFGIIDPQTGVTISQESYTPEHLIQPYSMNYLIVLTRSAKLLSSEHFRNLKINEMLSIRSLKIDSVSVYYIGLFYNKSDASRYLSYSREKGFKDSYIVTQYEINTAAKTLINPNSELRQNTGKIVYTIQLKAARQPIDLSEFKGIEGVREIASSDGYYRYIFGVFNSFNKAKDAIVTFLETGYEDAFIRDLTLLLNE